VKLLGGNRETSKEHSLHLDFWHNVQFGTVTLPRLTYPNVTVLEKGLMPLAEFLANSCYLEELDLVVVVESRLGGGFLMRLKNRMSISRSSI